MKISKELIPVIEKYGRPVGVIAGQDIEECDLVKPYSDGKVVLADSHVVSGVATHNVKENELVRIYPFPIVVYEFDCGKPFKADPEDIEIASSRYFEVGNIVDDPVILDIDHIQNNTDNTE